MEVSFKDKELEKCALDASYGLRKLGASRSKLFWRRLDSIRQSEIIKDFAPAVIYPPGEDLAEKLEEMKMDANDLAYRIGRTSKTINEILKGKCSLTLDVAMDLECVTGISAEYWMRRQYSYSNFLGVLNLIHYPYQR